MINRIKKILVKRTIISPWIKETSDWRKDDWRAYLDKTFNELKKTSWTRKFFPDLENLNYEDLDTYPIQYGYPSAPENYPRFLEWKSSGTVKPKVIRFSRRDVIPMIRSIGRFAYNIGKYDAEKGLGITSVEPFATATMVKFGISLIAKKCISIPIYQLEENSKEIVRNAKYDGLVTLVGFLLPFLKKVVSKYDVFKDDAAFILSGDVLTESIVKKIESYIERWGINISIQNFYACAEGGLIAASSTDYRQLIYYPENVGLRILTGKRELIDIMNARKGDVGEAIITIFRELMIPNYALGDLIEVIGYDNSGLPIISVLGRKIRKVAFELPGYGSIEGVAGAVLRVAGAPLNINALDEVLATFETSYLIIIDDYKLNARFTIYSEKKINEDTFWEKIRGNYQLRVWEEKRKIGIVDFEFITDRELIETFDSLVSKLVLDHRSPKLPRIIVRRHD